MHSRSRFCTSKALPLEVWLQIRAPARGFASKRSSRSRFCSKTELPLKLWPYFARLSLLKHSNYNDLLLKPNKYNNSAAVPVHSSDLLIFPSKPLHCFAPEPSLLKHNINTVLLRLCLCIVLTCLSFLRNNCTALHLSLHLSNPMNTVLLQYFFGCACA